MKREYRNVKKEANLYNGELWINDKFIQHITLSEVSYREIMLMIKLETLVDKETIEEIEDVMQLKFEDGADNAISYLENNS